MYGSLFPRHSLDVTVHQLKEIRVNILENVWPNNRNIAASVHCYLTGVSIDHSRHSEAISSSIDGTSLEDDKILIILNRGYRIASRALPRKPG